MLIVALLLLRSTILRRLRAQLDDAESQYRATKLTNAAITVTALISLLFIWIDAFGSLTTYLGLLSAGIAVALGDLLKNMAGWVYILESDVYIRVDDHGVTLIGRYLVDARRKRVVKSALWRSILDVVGGKPAVSFASRPPAPTSTPRSRCQQPLTEKQSLQLMSSSSPDTDTLTESFSPNFPSSMAVAIGSARPF